jgi:hypothetical protein
VLSRFRQGCLIAPTARISEGRQQLFPSSQPVDTDVLQVGIAQFPQHRIIDVLPFKQ